MSAVVPADDRPGHIWTAVFNDRRIVAALGLGFTSGIPFLLVYATQSAWLSDAGISIAAIGLLSELTLAYKLKFLWAPFLDRYDPPVVGRWLGRRRGWIIVAQTGVVAMLAGIAFGDPANMLAWTIAFSLALGFAGATLDLVIDGWRITSVRPPEKQAVLSSWTEIGWRIGNGGRRRCAVARRPDRLAGCLPLHGCPHAARHGGRAAGARAAFGSH